MRDYLRQVAVGAYVLWLVAVVLLVAGRYTGFPVLPGTWTGVVLGTAVFVVLGAGRVLRAGYSRLTE